MSFCTTFERYLNQETTTQMLEHDGVDIFVDLGETTPIRVNHMRLRKLSLVCIKPIGHEYRTIVHPDVTGRCRQQNPLVVLSQLVERLYPCSRAYQTLLIEDDKGIFDFCIFGYIIPGVNYYPAGGMFVKGETSALNQPFFTIPLFCSRKNVKRNGIFTE